jgi:predicted ribosome quality control (RQC) complex YloA/Tae2 family protein
LLTGLGIRRLLKSMKLEGLRLGKAWRSGDALAFEVTGPKRYLIARPGAIYLANYAPRGPSTGFPMFLRKHVSGRIVRSVEQHNVDRVVTLVFDGASLVFELFGRCNAIYLEDGKVVKSRHRSPRARRGGPYNPPESVDYLSLSGDEFVNLVEGKDKSEVSRALGIGPLVEEVWGEPGEIYRKLHELAERPLDLGEVTKEFRERDREELASQRTAEAGLRARDGGADDNARHPRPPGEARPCIAEG